MPPSEVIDAIEGAIERVLELSTSWLAWDGSPRVLDGNVWTPNKALRRTTDHLIDHLAQLASARDNSPGSNAIWLGRSVTLESDWARFTESDLNEAHARISRLGSMLQSWLVNVPRAEWNATRGDEWTVGQIAEHLIAIDIYAQCMGRINAAASPAAPIASASEAAESI